MQQAQGQFVTQRQENQLVLKVRTPTAKRAAALAATGRVQELELLAEDAAVYKLVGPVLIKQDQYEAKANVQKRLDFIAGEIASLESQVKNIDEKRLRKQQQARTQPHLGPSVGAQASATASKLLQVALLCPRPADRGRWGAGDEDTAGSAAPAGACSIAAGTLHSVTTA